MWLLGLLLYGSSRPKGTEAGRSLVVAAFLAVWVIAAILELLGVTP